jgi:hypothetical protein
VLPQLWAGDRPEQIEHLDADAFLGRIDAEGFGTKTTYVVTT